MYHPQVYKTGLCDHFDEADASTWKCVWGRRCAHAHGKDDLRTKEEATDAWKQHLNEVAPNVLSNPVLSAILQPMNVNTAIDAQNNNNSNASIKSLSIINSSTTSIIDTIKAGLLPSSDAGITNRTHQLSLNVPSNETSNATSQQATPRNNTSTVSSQHTSPIKTISNTGTSTDIWSQSTLSNTSINNNPSFDNRQPIWSNNEQSGSLSNDAIPTRTRATSLSSVSQLWNSNTSNLIQYDSARLIYTSSDQYNVYNGTCNGINVAVKVINKAGLNGATIDKIIDSINKLSQLSQQQHTYFIRYLDHNNNADDILIAYHLSHTEQALHKALPLILMTEQHVSQSLRYVQQLFTVLHSLHSLQISHNSITPASIYMSSTFDSIRVHDINRQSIVHSNSNLLEQYAADIYNAGTVSYYILTGGKLPFDCSTQQSIDEWTKLDVSTPLDTSSLTPTAAHFILHILFTPNDKRMTADTALRHPLFWTGDRAIQFITTVAQFIQHPANHEQHTDDNLLDNSLISNINEFCAQLDGLASSIIATSVNSQQSHTWTSSIHQALYHQYLQSTNIDCTTVDGDSVVSLIHFISDIVNHLLSAPLVSCHVHTLFHLPHLKNCARPRRNLTQQQQATNLLPPTNTQILQAVSDYFLTRFSSLLVSVFHLVTERWANSPIFQFYFNGQLPSMLPLPGADVDLTNNGYSRTQRGNNHLHPPTPRIHANSNRTPIHMNASTPTNNLSSPMSYHYQHNTPRSHTHSNTSTPSNALGYSVQSSPRHRHINSHPILSTATTRTHTRDNSADMVSHQRADSGSMASLLPALQCTYCTMLLNDPVTTLCCVKSMCRRCVSVYVRNCHHNKCECGATITQNDVDSLLRQSTNKALQSVLMLIQSQNTYGNHSNQKDTLLEQNSSPLLQY